MAIYHCSIDEVLKEKSVLEKERNVIQSRIIKSFLVFMFEEPKTSELFDIVSHFELIKKLAKKPMKFYTVYFYSFLKPEIKQKVRDFLYGYLFKSDDNLIGTMQSVENIYNINVVDTYKYGRNAELQKEIAKFYDATCDKDKSLGGVLHFILAGFKHIAPNDRLLFVYMDLISLKEDDEMKLYMFLKKLIEHIAPLPKDRYIDVRKILRNNAENSELDIKDISYKPFTSVRNFLEFFYNKFKSSIYKCFDYITTNVELSAESALYRKLREKGYTKEELSLYTNLKFDCEMDRLYGHSIENLTIQEIERSSLLLAEINLHNLKPLLQNKSDEEIEAQAS